MFTLIDSLATGFKTPANWLWLRSAWRDLSDSHSSLVVNQSSLFVTQLVIYAPEGSPGMSGVLPLSGISGLSFWFHFTISSLVLLPGHVTFSVLSFPTCWSFLLNFFQKILQYFSLRDKTFLYDSCLTARRNKLVGGMCSVLPYGTGICCYNNFVASVHSFFILFLIWYW